MGRLSFGQLVRDVMSYKDRYFFVEDLASDLRTCHPCRYSSISLEDLTVQVLKVLIKRNPLRNWPIQIRRRPFSTNTFEEEEELCIPAEEELSKEEEEEFSKDEELSTFMKTKGKYGKYYDVDDRRKDLICAVLAQFKVEMMDERLPNHMIGVIIDKPPPDLAERLASVAEGVGLPFHLISGPSQQDLISAAVAMTPSIVFIPELESIDQSLVDELSAWMDKLNTSDAYSGYVLVIGTTNKFRHVPCQLCCGPRFLNRYYTRERPEDPSFSESEEEEDEEARERPEVPSFPESKSESEDEEEEEEEDNDDYDDDDELLEEEEESSSGSMDSVDDAAVLKAEKDSSDSMDIDDNGMNESDDDDDHMLLTEMLSGILLPSC